jgi:hypothetical protein
MSFDRSRLPIAATILLLLLPVAANAITVDRVTVTGHGQSRANAIESAERSAVQIVANRYMARDATDAEHQLLIDQVLLRSKYYLNSFEILDDRIDAAGITEITAEARVDVDRLVTTLRNLDIAVTLLDPGPGQVVEGRR